MESLLHKLPENCSLEDIQYHLYVLDKVHHGLEAARQHGGPSQEDVEKRFEPMANRIISGIEILGL